MHVTQTIIGAGLLSALIAPVVSIFIPDIPPIVVHDLAVDGGMVTQSRTVTVDGDKFFAKWEAQIENAETGDIVCKGSGSWNYEVGTMDAKMDLQTWVGQEGCVYDSLPNGRYVPVATWYWGSDQTSHKGQEFVK